MVIYVKKRYKYNIYDDDIDIDIYIGNEIYDDNDDDED